MDRDDLDRWISTGDLDELLREVDRCVDRGDWTGLERLRDRSRSAIERGHQLWPAASFAEYRLALEAPGPVAAAAVVEGAGWFAPGPLTEVLAQGHDWDELSAHLMPGPARDLVAQERVLRGEDLTGRWDGELPPRLLAWEPGYELAEYRPDGEARIPAPELPAATTPLPGGAPPAGCPDGLDGARALTDAVRHWADHSDGRVRAVSVEGTAADAVRAVTALGENDRGAAPTTVSIGVADAAALLGWAAASGGAHGRRRGAATGRWEAWWALAVLTGLDDHWPVDPGPAAEELRWFRWAAGPETGWVCRLAVEDPDDGLAWALDATDRTSEK
ncbi:MAG: DUF6183 family protein [Microthrixaceae bacterium]